MNKISSVERLYSLGDFKNIKFSDSITEIPESFVLNKRAMELLRYIQILDIEDAYYRYARLMLNLKPHGVEEAMNFLETERNRTFEELLNELKKKDEE